MNDWPRPARPWTPILAALGVIGLWWLVAHNGGAGWVQFVGDLVFGALLVGIVGPAFVVGRVRAAICQAPTDGVAGLPVALQVVVSGRVRIRPVDPPGDDVFVGPAGRGGRRDSVVVVPSRRGEYRTVTVEIASGAPFALQWWQRRLTLALPHELVVAPRRGRPTRVRPDGREQETGTVVLRPWSDAGAPRGVRPYVPGDVRRRVHWRATAHTGAHMVKELEAPSDRAVTVVVDLPADPEEAERAASRALGTVVDLLEKGVPVVLQTMERAGPVVRPVRDRRQAGRRLGRAVSRDDATSVPPRAP